MQAALLVEFCLAHTVRVLCILPNQAVYINPRADAKDPRIGLKPGLYDAGEASFGLERIASLQKPAGFAPDLASIVLSEQSSAMPAVPDYGGVNSDMAFSGSHLFVGNYDGVNIYDISDPTKIRLVSSILCPGGQGDVSVYGHLLFMSVEAMNGRLDCGMGGFPPASSVPAPGMPFSLPPSISSPERIRGIRIFDFSNLSEPRQVADVQTCRGSHTHTLVLDPRDEKNVYLYVSEIANIRPKSELAGCSAGEPSIDPKTSLFSIDIVKVPLAHPELASVAASPHLFIDSRTSRIDGLWMGGYHGDGTQDTQATNGCHDITVYSEIGLAAGACIGNGILLNIRDLLHPVRIDAVVDPNYSFWHSATFSNDGTKVLFTDEWGAGQLPHCRATDPMSWGTDAIFKLQRGKLALASYYKMPAPQTDLENCVAHNGSLIPIPGRDVEVQAWYQGGISIVDFTDAAHPMEIGYFDRGPVNEHLLVLGGEWSAYYYNGFIFGSEIARGGDVFKLVPNHFLTQNEIDAASQVSLVRLNVQNQQHTVWPATVVTARAYLDQLERSDSLPPSTITTIRTALNANGASPRWGQLTQMAALAKDLERIAALTMTPIEGDRMRGLATILRIRAKK